MTKAEKKKDESTSKLTGSVRVNARNKRTHKVTVVSGRFAGASADVIVTRPSTGYFYRSGKLTNSAKPNLEAVED